MNHKFRRSSDVKSCFPKHYQCTKWPKMQQKSILLHICPTSLKFHYKIRSRISHCQDILLFCFFLFVYLFVCFLFSFIFSFATMLTFYLFSIVLHFRLNREINSYKTCRRSSNLKIGSMDYSEKSQVHGMTYKRPRMLQCQTYPIYNTNYMQVNKNTLLFLFKRAWSDPTFPTRCASLN